MPTQKAAVGHQRDGSASRSVGHQRDGSASRSVGAFLESLPEDRRAAITAVRKTVLKHLPKGYEESVAFGMLAYSVPLEVYPDTYNKNPLMYAAIASPKSYMAIHLPSAYGIPELRAKIEAGFRAAGKKLDMGKGCLRFKKLEDLELGVVGEVIAATPMAGYVAFAKAVHSPEARKERSKVRAAKPAAKKSGKPAAKKSEKPAAKK